MSALVIDRIAESDLPRAVEIFHQAFSSEHGERYASARRPEAFVHVWRFIVRTQPEGFFAARIDSKLVGYAIFVRSLKKLQRDALVRGAVLHWAWNALRGGFNIRPSALARIAKNKVQFVRNSRRFRTQGDAQLLNIAVDPAHRGAGIATQLVRAGLDRMGRYGVREVRLEVRPWNTSALHVYKETGWREVGRTSDLEGEWVVMVANP